MVRGAWRAIVHGVTKSRSRQRLSLPVALVCRSLPSLRQQYPDQSTLRRDPPPTKGLQLNEGSDDAYQFLAIKYFLPEVCTYF